MVKRTLRLPELDVLDAADPDEPCPKRAVTTTAPQALTLLNSTFLHEQAAHFADRLRKEAGEDRAKLVDRAFLLAFSRKPSDRESADSLAFLADQADRVRDRPKAEDRADPEGEALKAFCLVVLNSNEFVTVD
jgi:hypothetical protein